MSASRIVRWAAALAALAVLSPAETALAQGATFYLDRLQPSGAPDDGITVFRPYMSEKSRLYGSAALGYALNPLRADNITDDKIIANKIGNPVRHEMMTYLSGGAQFSGRFLVSLMLPIALYEEGGEDPLKYDVGNGLERQTAVHDLRLDARVKVIDLQKGLLRLGGGASVWFPTGNADAFGSDDQITGMLYGSGEFDFGDFILSGHLGPHFRPDRGIGNDKGTLSLGSEFRWAGGAYLPLRGDRVRLGGELWGTTGLDSATLFKGDNTTFEWLGNLRINLDEERRGWFTGGAGTRLSAGYGAADLRVFIQIGTHTGVSDVGPKETDDDKAKRRPSMSMRDTDKDGFPDDVDLCPTVKEDGKPPNPDDGCPVPPDRDGDGLLDDEDRCPDEPEDKDGLQDHDGCPEDDVDGDGIPDAVDACNTTPGVKNEDPTKNGCPEEKKPSKVIEEEGQLRLLEAIQFETGKAAIKPVSFPLLDEVVGVMTERPLLRIAVHGHTDNRGGRALNVRLSKERAAAVMKYLVEKGIDAKRLESEGFGPDRPVAPNDNDEGRAKNRRVEFKILE